MNITVQGRPLAYDGEPTIKALVETVSDHPRHCNVRLNGIVLLRDDFEHAPIADGDEVDLLYFMGGGAGSGLRHCD